jgi:hypothetical protein
LDLTKLTLDQFMCTGNAVIVPADPDAFLCVKSEIAPLVDAQLRILGGGYAIHKMKTGPEDVVLLYRDSPVGCYWGELLAVDSDHQDKKLSVPLILWGVKNRSLPASRKLSCPGKQALEKAWRVANCIIPDPWP